MKSSWRSPDGGSSVAPNTKIEPSEAVFRAWWSTASTPIRSFHTVSEGEFCEVELPIYGVLGSRATRGSHGQCLGALLGEPAHGRGTEAASAAGDDRRSVGEVHKSS